ncbi:MAG: hypothetical protein VZQ47_03365 [Treponema sp.]|nr:hypothetical protein [Treponema sp.]MEE3434583.1 hypothetical protein [Treponema sp.]
MNETKNSIASQTQPKIRDRLFIAIFGKDTERSKRWRLDLYNALNGTAYTDPDALQLNTIENVIYIKMYNDVSFLVDSQMTLYEQQSSPNQNMPLRGLLYFAELYQKHLAKNDLNLLRSSLIKIPKPRFVVFYNGEPSRPERYKLRLSEAFELEDKTGDFEWTADVININPGKNESLVKNCKAMYDYVRLVGKISDNKKAGMKIQRAVSEAVDWAIEENFLEGFVREQKEEIIGMYLTEFNEESAIRGWRQDGIEEGREEKAVEDARNMLKMNVGTTKQISQITGLPLDKVLELQKELAAQHAAPAN